MKWTTKLLIFLTSALMVPSVHAEFFVDVYGGKGSGTGDSFSGFYIEDTTSLYGTDTYNVWSAQDDLSDVESEIYGIRFGYWFNFGLGLALDGSHFKTIPEDSDTEISLTPLSFLIMYRYPLMTTVEFPRGRLHPYIGVGIAAGMAEVTTHYSYLYGDYDIDEDTSSYGFDARLGLKIFLTEHIAVFGEYRYTAIHVEQSASFQSGNSWLFPTVIRNHTVNNEADVQTHHFLGGIGYHF